MRDLAREQTATAIATLAHICMHGKSETAPITAASELLDRGWGKPLATTDLNLSTQPREIHELTDAELRARLAILRGEGPIDFDELKRQHQAQMLEREQEKLESFVPQCQSVEAVYNNRLFSIHRSKNTEA